MKGSVLERQWQSTGKKEILQLPSFAEITPTPPLGPFLTHVSFTVNGHWHRKKLQPELSSRGISFPTACSRTSTGWDLPSGDSFRSLGLNRTTDVLLFPCRFPLWMATTGMRPLAAKTKQCHRLSLLILSLWIRTLFYWSWIPEKVKIFLGWMKYK